MTEELMTLDEIAELFRCCRRHARDVITKMVDFPEIAPGSSLRNPLYIRAEVKAFIHRKRGNGSRNVRSARQIKEYT